MNLHHVELKVTQLLKVSSVHGNVFISSDKYQWNLKRGKKIKHLIIVIKFPSVGYIRLIPFDPYTNNNITF